MPIQGFEFSVTNSGAFSTGGGGGAGKAGFSPLGVSSGFFPEAACLFGQVATGDSFASARIFDGFAAGGEASILLENATVSSFELSTTPEGEIKMTTGLDFSLVTWEANAPGESENTKGWDLQGEVAI